MDSNSNEQNIIIEFLAKEGEKISEIKKRLKNIYGEHVLSDDKISEIVETIKGTSDYEEESS
jgi:Trk K+ transport system NAD-binding subunit